MKERAELRGREKNKYVADRVEGQSAMAFVASYIIDEKSAI